MTKGWSTRELAVFAGSTEKTIRYYHRVGLLAEPGRTAGGYRKYLVSHLLRLLRIRRLVDLGVPLAKVPAMEESAGSAERTLRALGVELDTALDRLRRARAEVATALRHPESVELPPGFGASAADMTAATRAFLLLCSGIFDAPTMETLRRAHSTPRTAAEVEFDRMPADATDEQREAVAEHIAPELRRLRHTYPDLVGAANRTGTGGRSALRLGIAELYSPAQIDTLRRADAMPVS